MRIGPRQALACGKSTGSNQRVAHVSVRICSPDPVRTRATGAGGTAVARVPNASPSVLARLVAVKFTRIALHHPGMHGIAVLCSIVVSKTPFGDSGNKEATARAGGRRVVFVASDVAGGAVVAASVLALGVRSYTLTRNGAPIASVVHATAIRVTKVHALTGH